jgi:DNA-binding CsgD family transcriptional regulator/transcriptional regulator with XRE-family HTH domain
MDQAALTFAASQQGRSCSLSADGDGLTPVQLRARRRALGLTQEALAREVGVSVNTVARWERGALAIRRPQEVRRRLDQLAFGNAESTDDGQPTPGSASVSWADEVLGRLDRLFVGRETEMGVFRVWLTAQNARPALLNVSGPGGVGKSMLMRAFHNFAEREAALPTALVDGRNCRPTPEGFLAALSAALGLPGETEPDLERVVGSLNKQHGLLLLDTFEVLADLTAFLRHEFLPRLDVGVRVVIASRYSLSNLWRRDDPWAAVIRHMELGGLHPVESATYLERRGITDTELRAELVDVARGHPLTLSLGTDLALQQGVRRFVASPEWHLTLRDLVERLLEDVNNAQIRELLVATSMVRQFDAGTLHALVGAELADGAFERLCRLSVVRPVATGLMLHDEVRRVLAEDLRWRDPSRYQELRRRALSHFRQQLNTADGRAREQVLAEQLFLWEDALVHSMLFADTEPDEVWLEPFCPADRDDVHRIWATWIGEIQSQDMPVGPVNRAFFDALLDYPETRIRIARDRDGQPIGFNACLPVCRDSLSILQLHPDHAPAVRAYFGTPAAPQLASHARSSKVRYLLHAAHTHKLADSVRAALARDFTALFAAGGVFLTTSPISAYKQLFERFGWERLPAARTWSCGVDDPVDSFVLDLRDVDIGGWIESLAQGRPTATAQDPTPRQSSASGRQLSKREQQVATLVGRGFSNRDIAAELVISERTAEAHVANIGSKLGLHARTQIAVWAAERGLVDSPSI